ncbi:MAG: hypothetical protein AVDCRST_MAG10-3741, partial [uncultured Acidimicrobiales bacterium]
VSSDDFLVARRQHDDRITARQECWHHSYERVASTSIFLAPWPSAWDHLGEGWARVAHPDAPRAVPDV